MNDMDYFVTLVGAAIGGLGFYIYISHGGVHNLDPVDEDSKKLLEDPEHSINKEESSLLIEGVENNVLDHPAAESSRIDLQMIEVPAQTIIEDDISAIDHVARQIQPIVSGDNFERDLGHIGNGIINLPAQRPPILRCGKLRLKHS